MTIGWDFSEIWVLFEHFDNVFELSDSGFLFSKQFFIVFERRSDDWVWSYTLRTIVMMMRIGWNSWKMWVLILSKIRWRQELVFLSFDSLRTYSWKAYIVFIIILLTLCKIVVFNRTLIAMILIYDFVSFNLKLNPFNMWTTIWADFIYVRFRELFFCFEGCESAVDIVGSGTYGWADDVGSSTVGRGGFDGEGSGDWTEKTLGCSIGGSLRGRIHSKLIVKLYNRVLLK